MGAPILFAVMFAIFAALPFKDRLGWTWIGICLVFAALAGWRLAYHLHHMRAADEYGGAYTSKAVYRQAARRYWLLAPLYALAAAAAGFGVLWWRGLP